MPLWYWYLGGILFLAVTNIINLEIPQLAKKVIDSIEHGGNNTSSVWQYPFWIIGLGLTQIGTRSLSRILIFWPGRHLEAALKSDIFTKLLHLPHKFYDAFGMGDIVSRLTNDTGQLRIFFAFGALQVINLIFLVIFTLSKMTSIHPALTGFCLIPLFTMFAVARFLMPKLQFYNKLSLDAQGRLTSRITEGFVNIHTVQANVAESAFIRGADRENLAVYDANMKVALARTFFFPLVGALGNIAQFIVLLYGGLAAIKGELSVGDLLAFNIYLNYLSFPLSAMGMILAIYQRAISAVERIKVIEESKEERASVQPAEDKFKDNEPLFAIRNLTYTFTKSPQDTGLAPKPFSLKNISLNWLPGEKLGLCGPIGGGKTTLFNLMTGILEPPPGTIFFRGIDITHMDPRKLRAHVAYALQQPQLFSDSIKGNLTLGLKSPLPDAKQLQIAIAKASIASDIERFPERFATEVGERGIKLSGGQKQRLALARVFLREVDAYLLDDVLSAVDYETENHLIDALGSSNTSWLIATHRPSILKRCHRIFVLDNGDLQEYASFERLALERPELVTSEERHHD